MCLGMVRNSAGVLVPQPNAMESRIRKIVTMHDEDYSRVSRCRISLCCRVGDGDFPPLQLRFGNGDIDALPLVLPPVPGGLSSQMAMMM